jgi:hypothetical protein
MHTTLVSGLEQKLIVADLPEEQEILLTADELRKIQGGITIIEVPLSDGSTVYKTYDDSGKLRSKSYDKERDGRIDTIKFFD